jgi:hypothetical protein
MNMGSAGRRFLGWSMSHLLVLVLDWGGMPLEEWCHGGVGVPPTVEVSDLI